MSLSCQDFAESYMRCIELSEMLSRKPGTPDIIRDLLQELDAEKPISRIPDIDTFFAEWNG